MNNKVDRTKGFITIGILLIIFGCVIGYIVNSPEFGAYIVCPGIFALALGFLLYLWELG